VTGRAGLFREWDLGPVPQPASSFQDGALRRHRLVRRWERAAAAGGDEPAAACDDDRDLTT
jgi:hypothetical protein